MSASRVPIRQSAAATSTGARQPRTPIRQTTAVKAHTLSTCMTNMPTVRMSRLNPVGSARIAANGG